MKFQNSKSLRNPGQQVISHIKYGDHSLNSLPSTSIRSLKLQRVRQIGIAGNVDLDSLDIIPGSKIVMALERRHHEGEDGGVVAVGVSQVQDAGRDVGDEGSFSRVPLPKVSYT